MRHLLAALFMLLSNAVLGQYAHWNCNGTLAPTSVNPKLTASSVSIAGGVQEAAGGNRFTADNDGNADGAYTLDNWGSGTAPGSAYVEVSYSPLTFADPRSNVTHTPQQFFLDHRRSAQGPVGFVVRAQAGSGSFIDLGTATNTESFGRSTFNFPGSFVNLSVRVTVRIYAYGAVSGSQGNMRFDDLTITGLAPMPVEFTLFKASAVGESVELLWQTAWERNSDYFEVQRSSDLREFVNLTTVRSAGDSQTQNSYTFTDASALPGVNYYRLRQVDRDGTWAFSKVIMAVFRPDAPAMVAYPNPCSRSNLTLRINNLDANKLVIYSLLGAEVWFELQPQTPNNFVVRFAPSQPAGLYIVAIENQRQRLWID